MTAEELCKQVLLEYLREHPDAWTSTIHWRITGNNRYAPTMALLKQMQEQGLVIGKKHSNNNIRWRIA